MAAKPLDYFFQIASELKVDRNDTDAQGNFTFNWDVLYAGIANENLRFLYSKRSLIDYLLGQTRERTVKSKEEDESYDNTSWFTNLQQMRDNVTAEIAGAEISVVSGRSRSAGIVTAGVRRN